MSLIVENFEFSKELIHFSGSFQNSTDVKEVLKYIQFKLIYFILNGSFSRFVMITCYQYNGMNIDFNSNV